jgi:hypothetical protein
MKGKGDLCAYALDSVKVYILSCLSKTLLKVNDKNPAIF